MISHSINDSKYKMKKYCFLYLLYLLPSLLYGQDFEGIIHYEMTYHSKSAEFSVEDLEKGGGKYVKSYIKNGYYKELTKSSFMSYQLFRHDHKAMYFKHGMEDDTLYHESTLAKTSNEFSYELYEGTDSILNVLCDKLVVKDKYGTKTYYYSSHYSLNPDYYKNYTLSNKYEILKIMKSIYLRLVMEFEHFVVDITAKTIERKDLKKDTFELPEYKVMAKSEY